MIYLLGAVAVLALIFMAGWSVGRISFRDRRRDVADVQATLDRTRRARDAADAGMRSAGPFPVGPGYIAMSDIMTGWDVLERQQRGERS